LLSRFEYSQFSFGFLKREWNRITFVLISVHFVTIVIRSEYIVISGVVSQGVLCALEVVKINILGVCCAKGSVFLEGFKVTSLVVLCVICN